MEIKQASRLVVLAGSFLLAGTALAEPALQVDIVGGTYDEDLKDVVIGDPNFTVLALCDVAEGENCTLETEFFLSIAVVASDGSEIGNTDPDLGSFTVNGTETVNVTADMVYGTPPIEELEALQEHDGGDLGPHGRFPTYFTDFAVDFVFSAVCGADQYNVANTPGTCTMPGTGSYYVAFVIDATNLAEGYGLHFDLYNANALIPVCTNTHKNECTSESDDFEGYDIDLESNGNVRFAPFSKDASYNCCQKVPEPGTLALLGIGLLGLGMSRRRKIVVES